MIPSAYEAARNWAQAEPALTAIVAGRVSSRLPAEPILPWLRTIVVDGGVDSAQIPIGVSIIQFEALAGSETHPDDVLADRLARTVVDRALDWRPGPVAGGIWISGFRVATGPNPVPDPDAGWARFIVDLQMTYRAA